MNVFVRKNLVISILICIGFSVVIGVSYYFGVVYPEKIKAQPQRYCYDTFHGPPNAALYITSLSDAASYLAYYQAAQTGENPVGNFPLNGLPTDVPVYFLDYANADSSLAEVASFYQPPLKSRPYFLTCYVYAPLLHLKPPRYK